MKKFLTLIKRDLTDYRGALVITPFAIAAFILLIALGTAVVGKSNMSTDGGFNIGYNNDTYGKGPSLTVRDDNGQKTVIHKNKNGVLVKEENGVETPVLGDISPEDVKKASQVFVFGTLIAASLPIGVAMIAIYFILAGALFDERKERTIMFWKSLPVSDLQTVIAKCASIVVGGLGIAALAGLALQLGLMAIMALTASNIGLNIINGAIVLTSMAKLWGIVLIALVVYALWALPVYAWFLAASAFAPKSPFFAAFLPIGLLPIIGKIFMPDSVKFLTEPLGHMLGVPALKAVSVALDVKEHSQADNISFDQISAMPILESMKDPSFLIGLLVSAALIYAAAEIRRRKAL